ncbi:hypothetical protein Tco_0350346, partial [Tanacetum coccineum]
LTSIIPAPERSELEASFVYSFYVFSGSSSSSLKFWVSFSLFSVVGVGYGYARKGTKRKPKPNKSKHGKERTKSNRSLKSSA